jgi:hypothetical protein
LDFRSDPLTTDDCNRRWARLFTSKCACLAPDHRSICTPHVSSRFTTNISAPDDTTRTFLGNLGCGRVGHPPFPGFGGPLTALRIVERQAQHQTTSPTRRLGPDIDVGKLEIWSPAFEDQFESFRQKSIEEIPEESKDNVHHETISLRGAPRYQPDVF